MASRRLYAAMAEVIKELDKETACCNGLDPELVRRLVPVLKADNPHFKADKFVAACGMANDIAPFGY